jgi:GT2 family glycosyltransferase
MNNKISVVIPNWNGKKYLETCLNSLKSQTLDNYEVIIVDNGSEDDSVSYIKNNFSFVKVIGLEKNEGFARAVNIGIKASKSELIFLLNNDTELPSNLLETLYNEANTEKNYLFFACKMVNYHQRDRIDSAGDRFAISVSHVQVLPIGYNESLDKYSIKKEVFSACGGAALYRREFFEKVGYFDEDFFAYQEDIDLSFRAQLQGYKCLFLPRAKIYHVRGGTTKRKSYWHSYYGHRNQVWLLIKNLPNYFFIRYFLQTVIYILVKFILDYFKMIIINKNEYKPKVKGRLDSFRLLNKMINKRKVILKNKKISNVELNNLIKY